MKKPWSFSFSETGPLKSFSSFVPIRTFSKTYNMVLAGSGGRIRKYH